MRPFGSLKTLKLPNKERAIDHLDHFVSHYMPHGHCYLWEPGLVGTHVISDALIGVAYTCISISLYLLIRKIKVPFSMVFVAFGIFIGACGLTHFMEVWTLWHADYWVAGFVKVVTAAASVATGIWLVILSPKIIAFAAAAKLSEDRGVKLEAAYTHLEQRVQERTADLEASTAREIAAREELQVLYAEAQKGNRLKDEFLATMSHELRTPLSVILGYSEVLKRPDVSPEESERALGAIHRNAGMQFQLINDLLDVSRIISGKMQLESRPVEVREPLMNAIESVSLAAKAKNITVHTEFANQECTVMGDDTRLQQIVWNLISNGIKFTDKGGQVWVRAYEEDSKLLIQVKDTGRGIDPSFLPHVFERFRQEDAGTNRKYGGLGLGLGIVRHLVELHGGTVSAESAGKNQGATFTIRLPISPLKAVSHSLSQAEKNSLARMHEKLRGKKVLVVDDEKDVRELLASSLKSAGLTVQSAESAEEGLQKIISFQPDVVVSDIGMPDMDGYSFIRYLRQQEKDDGTYTPAVALTAYAQEDVRKKVLDAGFQSYLTKPTQLEKLLEEISAVLKLG